MSGDIRASIIVPAHNESAVIARTLTTALDGARPGEFEIIVVCNGCTDTTARIAASVSADVVVVEVSEPSKSVALDAGNVVATRFPRIYLDADVDIDAASLRSLVAAVERPGIEAAGPRRVLDTQGSAFVVRAYYALWEQLPQVGQGLFGRGVIALSEEGHRRAAAQPRLMSDDLAVSEAFAAGERQIVDDAAVVVRLPRSSRDLLRRRIRVVTGNAQADRVEVRRPTSKTSISDLARLLRLRRQNVINIPVFVVVTVLARIGARRAVRSGDVTTWLRDESSRTSTVGSG